MKKNIIAFTLFILFGQLLHAQQSIIDKYAEMMDEMEYQEVIDDAAMNPNLESTLSVDERLTYWYIMSCAHVALANFDEAIALSQSSLDLCEKEYTNQSMEYASWFGHLGWIYLKRGNLAETLKYYNQSMQLHQQVGYYDVWDELISTENLAQAYFLIGQYEETEKLLNSIWETYTSDPERMSTPNYIMYLWSLAQIYIKTDRIELADDLYAQIDELTYSLSQEEQFRKENIMVFSTVLKDILGYCRRTGQSIRELAAFTILYHMRVKDTDYYVNDNKAKDLIAVAKTIYSSKLYDYLDAPILRANGYYASLMRNNALYVIEDEREKFWRSLEFDYNFFYSAAHQAKTPELISLCYNNYLQFKSILLNTNRNIRSTVYHSGNEVLIGKYDQLLKLNREIASLEKQHEVSPILESALRSLKQKAETAERELSEELPLLADAIYQQNITWKDVQKKLKRSECAIEFIAFDENNGWEKTGKRYYSALLIKKDDEYPTLISLFEQKDYDRLILKYTQGDTVQINDLYKDGELYDLVWKPLKDSINDCSKVYFSVSGSLNGLSLHAIPYENQYLRDIYDLHQLSSTRVLCSENLNHRVNTTNTLVVGNLKYDSLYSPLPNSEQEMTIIRDGLAALKMKDVKLLQQYEADRLTLLSINGKSPANLFISTHGVYKKQQLNELDTALDRSLLILSKSDTLSARDISVLNLSGLDMTILAACASGLGDIETNEGVFGLQRAFKLAGAKTIIMTLWEVPNKSVQIFMRRFLEQLKTRNKHEAFQKAQRQMKGEGVKDWGGFIMID